MGWRRAAVIGMACAAFVVGGCGSGDSAVCVANDVGRVCADGDRGSIVFSGSGLTPGSDVLIANPAVGVSSYRVREDGTFEPGGRGMLSYIAGTPFTFQVTATDGEGHSLEGEIGIAP